MANPRIEPNGKAKEPNVVHRARSLSPNQMTASLGAPLIMKAWPADWMRAPMVIQMKSVLPTMRSRTHPPKITRKLDISVGRTMP